MYGIATAATMHATPSTSVVVDMNIISTPPPISIPEAVRAVPLALPTTKGVLPEALSTVTYAPPQYSRAFSWHRETNPLHSARKAGFPSDV
jgi:hypothetical protein